LQREREGEGKERVTKPVTCAVSNVQQVDDCRGSFEHLEYLDLSNGGDWEAFLFIFESELLESDTSSSHFVFGFMHHSKGALSN